MSQPKIITYLKPQCGWSKGVRAVMTKYHLEFEDRDVINDPRNYQEMVQKSGQPYQPCVQIGNTMLADVSGDEVEGYLLQEGIVEPIETDHEVALDRGCTDEEHEEMRATTTQWTQF